MAPRSRRLPARTGILVTALAVAMSSLVSAAPSASAADVLLSQGKPATESASGGANYAPRNAVDGNTATRWASKSNTDPAWIRVDLGASATISRVRLQWDLSCAKAYRVETSDNDSTWTPIHTTADGKGGVEDLTVTGRGRYVRVYGTTRCRTGTSYGYSLQEFQVFGNTGPVDAEPPSPPSDLVASDVKPDSAKLTWKAATDNVAVTAYDIYNLGQFQKSVPATDLTTVMTGLRPNVTYGFYVNARDAAGNVSQASNTAEFKTPPAQEDPTPPTAPKNLRSTGVTANSVSLAWDPSTDNVGVTRYEIYTGATKVGDATGTSATIGGRSANTEYTFTVKAFDAVGNASPASNALTVKTRSGGDQVGAVTQIATDNDVPWGLAFLPNGDGIYARRDAQDIVKITPSGQKTTLGKVPGVSGTNGEGGLLGIELSPSFASDGLIYVYHTASGDNRIVRAKIENNSLTGWTTLLTGIPRNKFHNGGRLRFGADGKLYAGTGDGQNKNNPQNRQSLGGKVLRLNADGSAPSDNPFFAEGGNARYVWTLGHRNVQGLAVDSQGRMWQAELGDGSQDEVNLLQKGGNYGWPSCEGTGGSCGGFLAPKKTFSVGSASPSGLAIVNDVLFLAALRGERLYRMQISGSSVGTTTSHFQGTYGRLRTPEPAPDGSLWVTTSNGDKDSTAGNSSTKLLKVALN
ncbi:PQQ-dependent sugar dehydrogenase [Lentzea sp. BCCO 10_0061]|uniref:PQQ-dependent sugar dehydrogenase n=1 Tax=Lentzea sokolovensis TaxID=3095429 RepID=A0ABU4V4I6_9PSEU|nr:PQQ-dependent sugar dehydrogenase [Lentzea sp. BCCO 10_0061]MDX8146698.1 PQQ-dependent sugar dehydrogenase [Lentzea sp. BCCO 10_0061]